MGSGNTSGLTVVPSFGRHRSMSFLQLGAKFGRLVVGPFNTGYGWYRSLILLGAKLVGSDDTSGLTPAPSFGPHRRMSFLQLGAKFDRVVAGSGIASGLRRNMILFGAKVVGSGWHRSLSFLGAKAHGVVAGLGMASGSTLAPCDRVRTILGRSVI